MFLSCDESFGIVGLIAVGCREQYAQDLIDWGDDVSSRNRRSCVVTVFVTELKLHVSMSRSRLGSLCDVRSRSGRLHGC